MSESNERAGIGVDHKGGLTGFLVRLRGGVERLFTRRNAAVVAGGLTLSGCMFDATGLTIDPNATATLTRGDNTEGRTSTSTGGTTEEPTTGTTDATGTTEEPTTGTTTTGSTTSETNGSSCGDGVVDDAEECDDGGESKDCNDDCTVAECGDLVVNQTAEEECDDGEDSAVCNADCTVAECGDGYVNQSAGEVCDDGMNDGAYDGCAVDCGDFAPFCGDGVKNGPEACDPEAMEGPPCSDQCEIDFPCAFTSNGYTVPGTSPKKILYCEESGNDACGLTCTNPTVVQQGLPQYVGDLVTSQFSDFDKLCAQLGLGQADGVPTLKALDMCFAVSHYTPQNDYYKVQGGIDDFAGGITPISCAGTYQRIAELKCGF